MWPEAQVGQVPVESVRVVVKKQELIEWELNRSRTHHTRFWIKDSILKKLIVCWL